MLNYIPFYTRIWSDRKFKNLSVDARILFIYLFANDDVTLTGIYNLDVDTCIFKVKINSKFEPAFQEVVDSNLVRWDSEAEKIFVINRFKLIPNKSPKVIQGVIHELNIIKHPFKNEFIAMYSEFLKDYLANLKGYEPKNDNLLTVEQATTFAKIGWGKERLKKFYTDRDYNVENVESILVKVFDKMK
jgi:hypothetical protein